MQPEAFPALAQGIYCALATPCRPDSTEVDSATLLEYLDQVASSGVNGFVLFGSTGEFVHFDKEERMRTTGLAIKRSRLPILVNVSHSTLAGARELSEGAIDSGASGLLLMPPYFYRYGEDEVEHFFWAFAEAINQRLPIYLYNLPVFTNAIPMKVISNLLSSGAYAGIKDSSGDPELLKSLLRLRDQKPYCLLAGNERLLFRALQDRVDGSVSGIAAAIPELPAAMWRAAQAGDDSSLAELERYVESYLDWVDRFPATIVIKRTAAFRNWLASCEAVPLGNDAAAELKKFDSWLELWLPSVLLRCSSIAPQAS